MKEVKLHGQVLRVALRHNAEFVALKQISTNRSRETPELLGSC